MNNLKCFPICICWPEYVVTCTLALITSGSRWGESGKHWSSFPWMSHRGLNYCSIGIKDKKIQSVIGEGCGLQLINVLNTLHDASFQAQIRVWEAARGRSGMLESDNVPPSEAGDEAEDGLLVAAWTCPVLDPVADLTTSVTSVSPSWPLKNCPTESESMVHLGVVAHGRVLFWMHGRVFLATVLPTYLVYLSIHW